MSESATLTVQPIRPIVIGTAGHVDHGKSSLVRALTGIDPDRLKEEKDRGLTIDIGFANFLHRDGCRVGIVDVPGHERFIKNMVTGATGVDLVVLVVAANDGVMLQTREHLEILTLLGKKHGIIAITKSDLVDADMVELAEADIRDAVAGTFLENAPAYPISTHTGAGMQEFRAGLADAIDQITPHDSVGAFRMPVQRVFSARGHGAVLTGIPLSGVIAIGDEVETMPSSQRGKIRSVQAYHGQREKAQAGHSSALNISSIDHKEVHRGHVVASPGYATVVVSLVARLRLLPGLERGLRHGAEVKLLIDNSEVVGELVIPGPGRAELAPGSTSIVQIRLEEAIVPAVGDRFVLRLPSPAITAGGGRVVSLAEASIRRADPELLEFFDAKADSLDNPAKLAELTIQEAGPQGLPPQDVAKAMWLRREELEPLVAGLLKSGNVMQKFVSRLVHRKSWEALEVRVMALAEEHHVANPQSPGIREAELQQRAGLEARALSEVVAGLLESGKLKRTGEVLAHHKYTVSFTPAQEAGLATIKRLLHESGFAPPSIAELQQSTGLPEKSFRAVTGYLQSRGEAVVIAGEFLISQERLQEAVELAYGFIREHGELKATDFKSVLNTTRKYAIPLLEYLDGKGTFINRGGVRLMRQ